MLRLEDKDASEMDRVIVLNPFAVGVMIPDLESGMDIAKDEFDPVLVREVPAFRPLSTLPCHELGGIDLLAAG